MASYTPGTPDDRFSATGPPQKSGRSPCLIIMIIVLALVAVPMCCCGGCLGFLYFGGQKSPAYQKALPVVQADARVQQKLGQPVEGVFVTSFNTNVTTDGGTADASFMVNGPQGSATVDCAAEKANGEWTLTRCVIAFEDGTTVDLLTDGELPAEDAGGEIELAPEDFQADLPSVEEATDESRNDK